MVKIMSIKKKEIQSVQDLMIFVEKYKYVILKDICHDQGLDIEKQAPLFFSSITLNNILGGI